MAYTYTVNIEVPAEHIADWVTSAFEGGSNYWIELVDNTHRSCKNVRKVVSDKYINFYCHKELYEMPDWQMNITISEGPIVEDGPTTFIFDAAAVQRGLNWLAKNRPAKLGELMDMDACLWDADDADCFLQACLFEDIVFG